MTYGYPRLGQMGRLGNQLWQIAGSLAIAEANNSELTLPPWEYASYFSVPDRIFDNLECTDAADCAPWLGPAAPYLQDQAFVLQQEKRLRDWFAPSEMARSMVRSIDFPQHAVAIHVRRGDYVTLPEYYAQLGTFWYSQAMQLVREEQPDAKFVCFSDDPDWCRNYLSPEIFVMATGHEMLDFWLMASCDRHIIANSCFSWWAAWLSGDPSVVVPKKWYGPAYSYIDEAARFHYPGWIVL